jgi:hypothetical protein
VVSFGGGGVQVTTWSVPGSAEQNWRARKGERTADFEAPRDAPVEVLFAHARRALGLPPESYDEQVLEEGYGT